MSRFDLGQLPDRYAVKPGDVVFKSRGEPNIACAAGEPIEREDAAQVALDIIGIIKAHHIVGVWSNEVAQNNMRNAIDDYFFDVLRDEKGVGVPVEMLDDLEQKIVDLARARFP